MEKYDGSFGDLLLKYQQNKSIHVREIWKSVKILIYKLHQNNIIHRDIHVENILYKIINDQYHIIIADYGMSIESDLQELRNEDIISYENVFKLIDMIDNGDLFENVEDLIFAILEDKHPIMINWKQNICPIW